MAQSNQIAFTMSGKDLDEIKSAIAVLKTKLLPNLATLSAQDRHELPKMGDKTVAFVQKALEYAQKNASLVPTYLDLEAMQVDVRGTQALRELSQELAPIADAVSDSVMLSGSEAYQAALVFYNTVKNAAKVKVASAGSIYDDLSGRFPGAPLKKAMATKA